uniref:Uncharacterized protein n=1 Tax=Rhizophora mucronata TaxID=61149 RepID=A0A2P2NC59_RHIMU
MTARCSPNSYFGDELSTGSVYLVQLSVGEQKV